MDAQAYFMDFQHMLYIYHPNDWRHARSGDLQAGL